MKIKPAEVINSRERKRKENNRSCATELNSKACWNADTNFYDDSNACRDTSLK